MESLALCIDGIPEDRHYGRTRTLRRYEAQEWAGTVVQNDKQISLVGEEDMVEIAVGLGLPYQQIEDRSEMSVARFMAQVLAANVLLTSSGSQRLNSIAASGIVLVFGSVFNNSPPSCKISEFNQPCNQPIATLLNAFAKLDIAEPRPPEELRTLFKRVARWKRGWVGSVFSEGSVLVGQQLSVYRSLQPGQNTSSSS